MELLPTIYFRCLKLYYLYTFANEHKNELFLQPKQSMKCIIKTKMNSKKTRHVTFIELTLRKKTKKVKMK